MLRRIAMPNIDRTKKTPSEAKRGIVRIASNFTRLGITFVLGIYLVRILLRVLGNEGLGLVSLLGSSMGLAAVLNGVLYDSSVKELAAAYHRSDQAFRETYNTSLALSLVFGLVTSFVFVLLILLAPVLFELPEGYLGVTQAFIALQAVRSFAAVCLVPVLNMFQVTEQMVADNLQRVVDRSTYIVAAGLTLLVQGDQVAPGSVVIYGAFQVGLAICANLIAAIILIVRDRRLVPSPRYISRAAMRSILSVGAWNVSSRIASDLHLRTDNYLMNLWLGVVMGNVVFGALAVTLTAYTRMIATGVSSGLTAVAARVSTRSQDGAMQKLTYHTSRLQAVCIVPATAILLILAEPILAVWVGNRLDDPTGELMRVTAILVRILAIGTLCLAASESITNILYGAGHIHRYAPYLLAGGVANPIFSVILLVLLPDSLKFIGPACVFSLLMIIVYGWVVPRIASRTLSIPLGQIYTPFVRPLILTVFCSPILMIPAIVLESWTLFWFIGVVGVFGAVYGTLCAYFVVTPDERARVLRAVGVGRERRPAPDEVSV